MGPKRVSLVGGVEKRVDPHTPVKGHLVSPTDRVSLLLPMSGPCTRKWTGSTTRRTTCRSWVGSQGRDLAGDGEERLSQWYNVTVTHRRPVGLKERWGVEGRGPYSWSRESEWETSDIKGRKTKVRKHGRYTVTIGPPETPKTWWPSTDWSAMQWGVDLVESRTGDLPSRAYKITLG